MRQLVFYSAILICAGCATKDDKIPAAVPGVATMQSVIPSQPTPTPIPSTMQPAPQLGVLPATFKGDLPCADCTAIQYQLDLFADRTYDLSMIHRGKSSG